MSLVARKFYYLITCEYCFSHYVALVFLLLTRYQLLYPGWRGYVIAEFALVWISNVYISIFNRLRLAIRIERVEMETKETAGQLLDYQRDSIPRPKSSKEITMSKAKSETNAISMLKKDHESVKGLFDKFEKTENPAEKQKIIAEAIQELKIHATIEEEIFYPAIRNEVEDDILDEAEVEHHVARMLIAELDQAKDSDDYRNARFTVLSEAVRHHIKEEEGQMFPKVKEGDTDLDSLGEQMMQRKEELESDGVPEDSEHEMVAANPVKGREKTTMASARKPKEQSSDRETRKEPSRKK